MVPTFDLLPLLRIELMDGRSPHPGAGPEQVRIAVVEFPLDGQVGSLLDVRACVQLLAPMDAFDHLPAAIRIAPQGELRDEMLADALVFMGFHDPERFPAL